MNRIGIVIEGESDQKIIKVMVKKLGISPEPKIVQSNDKGNLLKGGWKGFVYGRIGDDCSKKIILVDYDTDDALNCDFRKKLENEVTDEKVIIHFAKRAIESWLLGCFDEKNPDNLPDPMEEIKKIFRGKYGAKRRYNKTADGKQIAEKNELKHFKASESFRKFEEILRDD